MTSSESHSTLVTVLVGRLRLWWNLPLPRPRPLSLLGICGGTSNGSGKGNCTLLKAQWLPRPVRVCRPLEVPIAKSGLGFVVVGQAAEDQREVVVRMRMGWVTIMSVYSFLKMGLGGGGVQDDGQR